MKSRLGIAVVAFSLAFFATDAIYTHAVVPRLAEVREVPLHWWLGVSLPLLIAPVVAGWRARSFVEVVVLALCAAGSYVVFGAANGQFTGNGRHDIDGSALVYFNTFMLCALAFVVMATSWVARRILHRARPTSEGS